MSTWITPVGQIGANTTTGQPYSFTLQATASLGGAVYYQMALNTTLPPGLVLNQNTGEISGTPAYVNANVQTNFYISATENVNGAPVLNIREFWIIVTTLVWATPQNLGIFQEQFPLNLQLDATPSQPANTVTYALINGTLPTGTVSPVSISSGGLLTGTPDAISETTNYTFTIRAREFDGVTQVGFRDRTFTMTIDIGTPLPYFTTPAGSLFTVLDSTWVQFPIQYVDQVSNDTIVIDVAIGSLPPGLEITSAGVIQGYALPPTDLSGNAINQTYTFTLQITGINGRSIAQYTITVNNQSLLLGFPGRAPTLLNTQPLTIVISPDDPYAPYYLTDSNIGQFLQNTDLIFKMIGYNFDTQDGTDVSYLFNASGGTGLTMSPAGWISGILPTINQNIETFNFTVSVYRTSDPTLISDTYLFELTVVGDIDTQVTWVTASNLGTINNGAVSMLAVEATSSQALPLRYRIVGNANQSNFKTISTSGGQFDVLGDRGAFVTGSSDGQTWTTESSITSSVTFLNFTASVYDPLTLSFILVGYEQSGGSVIGQLTGTPGNYTASAVLAANPLYGVCINAGLYIAVGDAGTITYTLDPTLWSDIAFSGTTNTLNSICWGNAQYVIVGDQSTIITSPDGITWTLQTYASTISLRSVIWADTQYIAVGDLGLIITSPDGITWTQVTQITAINSRTVDYNFKSVCISSTLDRILVVGEEGVIFESVDGIKFVQIQNYITTATLWSIVYDGTNTNSFFIAGDAGTVIQYDNEPLSPTYLQLSSPTLTRLPPDLQLLSTGEISGRLAFESTDTIISQGTTATYTFAVQAYSQDFPQINAVQTFTLTTYQEFYLPYDNIYVKCLATLDDRQKVNQILYNGTMIPPDMVYRYDDPYFGVATDISYELIYGVPSVASDDFFQTYIDAVQTNYYWKQVTLGQLKTAVARDEFGNIEYEVVYSQIVDDLVNNEGVSISKDIIWPRNIQLNLNNWVSSLTTVYTTNTYDPHYLLVKTFVSTPDGGTTLVLDSVEGITPYMNLQTVVNYPIVNAGDGTPPLVLTVDIVTSTITVSVPQPQFTTDEQLLFYTPEYVSLTPASPNNNRELYPNSIPNMQNQVYDAIGRVNSTNILPLWMRSVQQDGTIPGYTGAWVICYTKPGYSATILNNIQTQWPYTLNEIDFEMDRFEVDRSKTYNYEGVDGSGNPQWVTLPSAQPNVVGNSADSFIYFPRRNILSQPQNL